MIPVTPANTPMLKARATLIRSDCFICRLKIIFHGKRARIKSQSAEYTSRSSQITAYAAQDLTKRRDSPALKTVNVTDCCRSQHLSPPICPWSWVPQIACQVAMMWTANCRFMVMMSAQMSFASQPPGISRRSVMPNDVFVSPSAIDCRL